MTQTLATEVRMIKGVGPQRAELLAKRGIYTLEDLLTYLPFRYEDRIHFSNIKDIQPNGTYTIRARVMSGQAIRGMYGRNAIYHLLVQDEAGASLPCKFFHGGYLEGRLKPGQWLILHGKAEVDKLRPARIEMVNPQIELCSEEMDSTEVGRIVPIYEAIGTFGSRAIRRAIYGAVQHIDPNMPDVPTVIELSNDPEVRQIFANLVSNDEVGRSLFTTPNVPPARLALLRSAFQKMLADPDFRAEAQRLNLPLVSRTGEEMQQLVRDTLDVPATTLAKIRELVR